ncbi:MAG: NADH-quinone oxidoreductase subunit C, partial [Gemmatimonadota bacterium]|nr:NADH-quinone oxidoreductase subunit C [Gemmatimonadota bacterium]
MSDESRSGLDAVDEGVLVEGAASPYNEAPPEARNDHASVAALYQRFGGAVVRHQVNAGGQHVVFVDPSRSLEILTWLRDDAEHRYDMCSDVTAVDYGAGRPVNVVYQLFSTTHKRALRVRCELPLDALEIDSV